MTDNKMSDEEIAYYVVRCPFCAPFQPNTYYCAQCIHKFERVKDALSTKSQRITELEKENEILNNRVSLLSVSANKIREAYDNGYIKKVESERDQALRQVVMMRESIKLFSQDLVHKVLLLEKALSNPSPAITEIEEGASSVRVVRGTPEVGDKTVVVTEKWLNEIEERLKQLNSWFHCKHCNTDFYDFNGYSAHIEEILRLKESQTCPFCKTWCVSFPGVINHIPGCEKNFRERDNQSRLKVAVEALENTVKSFEFWNKQLKSGIRISEFIIPEEIINVISKLKE